MEFPPRHFLGLSRYGRTYNTSTGLSGSRKERQGLGIMKRWMWLGLFVACVGLAVWLTRSGGKPDAAPASTDKANITDAPPPEAGERGSSPLDNITPNPSGGVPNPAMPPNPAQIP